VLDRVGSALSAATQGASLVLAPKHEAPIQHIDFVPLSAEQALVVLVFSDGHVENRIFNPPARDHTQRHAGGREFLNARLAGQTVSSLRT
jgi:heat-inducible transcriptional repressor